MSEKQTPTCQTCGYDLSGILRKDGTTTCPECSYDGKPIYPSEIIAEKRRRRTVDLKMLTCMLIFLILPISILFLASLFFMY